MRIADFEIGSKCFIVAELSGNHGGDYETAEHMIDTIQPLNEEYGPVAVKLQTYLPEDMPDKDDIVKGYGKWDGWTWKDVYRRTLMPWTHQLALRDYAQKKGMILFSAVCSNTAVDWWESHGGLPAYKIASWQSGDAELIHHISHIERVCDKCGTSRPVPIIISLARMGDWQIWRPDNAAFLAKDDLGLLAEMLHPDSFREDVGYSNHGPIENCIEAVKRGAVIVEQHFTLSRDTIDGQFAALPAEFGYMVREVRKCSCKTTK